MSNQTELASQILSDVTHFMKYGRYIDSWGRREVYEESIIRSREMHIRKYPQLRDEIIEVFKMVLDRKVLPSMRALQFAGRPAEISNNRIYNCSYTAIRSLETFREAMFLLLGGTGLGISVQRHHISQLPPIKRPSKRTKRYLIEDSINGWADAIKMLIKSYFSGTSTLVFDFSEIRAKGERLMTSGGKAPGPEPLKTCIRQITELLDSKKDGEYLRPIDAHDIICYIADAVLAGGIRRAALISLFSPEDAEMMNAKHHAIPVDEVIRIEPATYTDANGIQQDKNKMLLTVRQGSRLYKNIELRATKDGTYPDLEQLKNTNTLGWWVTNPQRGRANNSVVLERSSTTYDRFRNIWKLIQEGQTGEPGIAWTNNPDMGLNPCAEVSLEDGGFCNLTTINGSTIVDQEDLNQRAKAAAFIGTLQAGYTDFHYLRDLWKQTSEKDALLGVSITGIASGRLDNLNLKEAVACIAQENERVAKLIGINKAARLTAIKPEGTSSLLLGTSSGIHAWHAPYYIRRIRIGKTEALYKYLADNHPELLEDDVFKPELMAVISVPQKAPDGAVVRTEPTIDLLKRIQRFNQEWIKPGHRSGSNYNNVSATVSVRPDEWETVREWMWENRVDYNGLTVLPFDGGSYVQAPFEEITKEEYESLLPSLKAIDLTQVREEEDKTNFTGEVACGGGACEVR